MISVILESQKLRSVRPNFPGFGATFIPKEEIRGGSKQGPTYQSNPDNKIGYRMSPVLISSFHQEFDHQQPTDLQ
jgi:hypothetical protein